MTFIAYVSPVPKAQFLDNNGFVLAGGLVYTYQAGTTTPLVTYTDGISGIANTNPVVLDSSGRADIWLGPTLYKIVLKTSAGTTIWTEDNISGTGFINGNFITYWGGTSAGSANALAITTSPSFSSYTTPLQITFIAGFSNTSAATLNANSIGVKNLYRESPTGPVPLVGGEIVIGNIYTATYDGTRFQLTSGLPASSGIQITAAGGTSDAITATYSTAITGLTDQLFLAFTAASPNLTTAPTFSPNGLTAHPITKQGGYPLSPGDIANTGATYIVEYNLASTRWDLLNPSTTAAIQGNFRNLRIKWASNTTFTITADEISVQQGAIDLTRRVDNVSVTNTITTSGINGLDSGTLSPSTWYSVWVMSDGTNTGSLISLQFNAGSISYPGSYVFAARVGAIRTDSSSHIIGFIQNDRIFQWQPGNNLTNIPTIATGILGNPTAPTYVASSFSTAVAPTASKISIILSGSVNGTIVAAAPNASYGLPGANNNLLISNSGGPNVDLHIKADYAIDNATNFYYASSEATGNLSVNGYEDSI